MKKLFYSVAFFVLFGGLVSNDYMFAGKKKAKTSIKKIKRGRRKDSDMAILKEVVGKVASEKKDLNKKLNKLFQDKKIDKNARTSIRNFKADVDSCGNKIDRLNKYKKLLEFQDVFFEKLENNIELHNFFDKKFSFFQEMIKRCSIPVKIEKLTSDDPEYGLTDEGYNLFYKKEKPFELEELNDIVLSCLGTYSDKKKILDRLCNADCLSMADKTLALFVSAFAEFSHSFSEKLSSDKDLNFAQTDVSLFIDKKLGDFFDWEKIFCADDGESVNAMTIYNRFKKMGVPFYRQKLGYYAQAVLLSLGSPAGFCKNFLTEGKVLCQKYQAAKKDYKKLFDLLFSIYSDNKFVKKILLRKKKPKKIKKHYALSLFEDIIEKREKIKQQAPIRSLTISVEKMIESNVFFQKEKEASVQKYQYKPDSPGVKCSKRVLDWYSTYKQKKEPFKDVVRHTFWPIVDSYIMNSNFAITLVNEDDECDESVNIPGAIEFKDSTRLTGVFSYGLAKKDEKVLCWHRWFQTKVLPEVLKKFKACMKAVNKKTRELKNDLEIKTSVCASDKTIKKMEIPDFFVKYFKENSDDPIKSITLYYLPTE